MQFYQQLEIHTLKVYTFENGHGKYQDIYSENIFIEDIHELSKNEIGELASETATKLMDGKVSLDSISYDSVYDKTISYFEESNKNSYLEPYDIKIEFPDDIFINDERPPLSSKYTLDLIIDDLGQDTEEINLEIPDAYYALNGNLDKLQKLIQNYAYEFYNLKILTEEIMQFGDEEELNLLTEDFLHGDLLSDLESYGDFKASDERGLPELRSFVNDPITWVVEDKSLILYNHRIHQTVFDTTFSGIATNEDSDSAIITFVEEGFSGFALDDLSVEKDNITIEGK